MSVNKKKILIIGVNYYPEDSAIGLYTTEKAQYLSNKGFDVSVITGFPYYPKWDIYKAYKTKPLWTKEIINNVNVYRYKQYVPKKPTFLKRILHLTSFTLGSLINLFKTSKPNYIICIVPFTTTIVLGWFLKLRYKSKLWIHIQDFEFDAAIDSGLLKGNKKIVVNLLKSIEKFVLKKADIISTISFGMINKLKTKTKAKTYYLTNWVDIKKFSNDAIKTHKYLISSAFKILYSGNIGAKQDWVFFTEFLNQLKEVDNVEIILVGEGAEKDNLLSKIKDYNFVKHYNLVPHKELPSLLSSADLHILFQKTDVIDTVMPSKILGMMASAKPSIVTGNLKSEVATVFEDSKGGFYFDGKSIKLLVNQIILLKENKQMCVELGQNAKAYVEEKYSKDKVLSQFMSQLKKL